MPFVTKQWIFAVSNLKNTNCQNKEYFIAEMFMSFLNALPLPVLVLLGFAVLGLCDYLKKLHTLRAKIKMFSNYRNVLVKFHNNVEEGKGIDPELSDYLLENSMRIDLDSVVKMEIRYPISGILTGFVHNINDIVTGKCHDFTGTCHGIVNALSQSIGYFKDVFQKTRSKIINPIYLPKNGVSLIFNSIPIVNLMPTNLKNILIKIFLFISVVETLLSLFSQKLLIEQIIEWISQ